MLSSSQNEEACTCLEMNLKPIYRRITSTSSAATKDELNSNIDDKYAVIHWSDAHKMCISDGEPVLIVCTNNNDNRGGDDDSSAAIVCPVRISSSSSTPSSAKKGTPQSSKKKGTQYKAIAGDVILSPNSEYDYLLRTKSTDDNSSIQTKPTTAQSSSCISPSVPSTTANNNKTTQYTSPSKSSFSFSKGGGGESLVSPTPTASKYISPSGSKFSFSKNGIGGNTSHTKPTTPSTQTIAPTTKVMVIPLVNLSSKQQCKLCPHAQTIQIYPLFSIDSSSTADVSSFISSSKIIQTLVISKYKNKYVQPLLSGDVTVSSRDVQSKYETISISFRGQIEHFHVVNVIPDIQGSTKQKHDENEDLTTIFDQLDISKDTSGQSDSDSALKSVQQHLKQRESEKRSDIAYKITSQTKIDIVSSLERVQSTQTTDQANKPTATKQQQIMCAGLDTTLSRVKDALLPPLLHPNLFPADGPL